LSDLTEDSLVQAMLDIMSLAENRDKKISINPTKILIHPYNLKYFKEPKKKMYKLMLNGKRYNTKTYNSYEDARKYVRRLVTKKLGAYFDDYTQFGFNIQPM